MKTSKLIKPVLAISIALLLPLPVIAMPGNIAQFDTNNDGQVTDTELQAGLTAEFTKIDTDASTYLSLAEMEVWQNSQQVERFNALDIDKSTTLTLAELQTTATTTTQLRELMSSEIFNLMDTDGNSILSWTEYAVLEPGKGELIRHFAHMDADNDGKISSAEFLNAPTPGNHGGGSRGRR